MNSSKRAMLRGLPNTWSAPCSLKKLMSSGSKLPVTPSTGTWHPISRSLLVAVGPFITGISKSMMIASKWTSVCSAATYRSMACCPSSACSHTYPFEVRMRMSILRLEEASSTTRMRFGNTKRGAVSSTAHSKIELRSLSERLVLPLVLILS